jgi:hypothetical protein
MQEVSALCDAIVVIAGGHVVARGTPDELRRQTGRDNLEDAFRRAGGRRARDGRIMSADSRSSDGSRRASALHQTLIVIRKELKDSLRDRRALFSIAFSIVVGPVLIGFMMNRIADRQREAENVEIPVVGQQHAPAFVDWLRQQAGVTVIAGPARPEQAVRDRANDVVVVISEDYANKFRDSRPATVKIIADTSRNSARPAIERGAAAALAL